MNHGNIKRKQTKLDELVERLNHRIGRLLGKKHKFAPPKKTKNSTFALIIFAFTVVLWSMTGFYYVNEDQYGVVLFNGKITQTLTGLKIGLTWPYPFGGVGIINASISDMLNLGLDGANSSDYITLTKDLIPATVTAKFTYQVVNPQVFYLRRSQDQDSLDNLVRWNLEAGLHNYIANYDFDQLSKMNLTIIAGTLRDKTNAQLAAYGLRVVKLSINSIGVVNGNIESSPTANVVFGGAESITKQQLASTNTANPIANELLMQARQYQQDQLAQTQANVNRFNQLVVEYNANPEAIVGQMYYELLSSVPVNKSNPYPLLNMSLSDLLELSKLVPEQQPAPLKATLNNTSVRMVDRSVNRERNLNGR